MVKSLHKLIHIYRPRKVLSKRTIHIPPHIRIKYQLTFNKMLDIDAIKLPGSTFNLKAPKVGHEQYSIVTGK